MKQPVAKLLIGFFIVAVVLVAAMALYTFSQPAPAPPPLPNPNGYDDFVKAGSMITDNAWEYATMSKEELRAFVSKNAEALKLARTGLRRECRVPLDYSATNVLRLSHLAAIKRLAQVIAAEGRLAELENRPADAAQAYLTVVRLGSAISQGGVLIDLLVSIAIESIGSTGLKKLAPSLDAKQCRAGATVLEACEAQREPMDVTLTRERAWWRRSFGLKMQITRLLAFKLVKQSEQFCMANLKTHQTRTRLLLIQLATRAYELDKGEPPKSLADLVPAYLKAIPQDPLAGTNMAYP